MTSTEARVRAALHDMAAESQQVPLLTSLMRRRAVERRHRRIIVASAGAAAAAAVAGGMLLAGYVPTKAPQPAQPTVKSFHLSQRSSTHPGSASMFVTVSRGAAAALTAYVLPTTGGAAVRFGPKADAQETVDQQQLSADGRFLLELRDIFHPGNNPGVVLTDLATGQAQRFAAPQYVWVGLSPDAKTLALRDQTRVTLIDVTTGVSRVLPQLRLKAAVSVQMGWSPDGRLLAVENLKDTLIVDLGGHIRHRLPGVSLVNGSMSWSPDGHSILVYDGSHPGVRVTPVAGGPGLEVSPPAGALRALGWAGTRVVWLAGQPGAQRLVTTDVQGRDAATWMKFHVGSQTVGGVSWTRAMGR